MFPKLRAWQKEGNTWLRPSWILLLLLPWLATWICLGVHQNRLIRDLPVAYLDLDHSAASRALIRQAEMLPQVQLLPCSNLAECQQSIQEAEVEGVLVIENGYAYDLREGRTAHVSLWRQAGNSATSAQIQAAFGGLIGAENAKMTASRMVATGLPSSQAQTRASALRLESHLIGNHALDYLRYLGGALLPLFLQMGWMLAGASLRPRSLKQMWPALMFWLAYSGLTGLAMIKVFLPDLGLPQIGGYSLWLAFVLFSLASLLLGQGLRRFFGEADKSAQWTLVINTPAFLLSGLTFPGWAMPTVLSAIGSWHPYSFYLNLQLAQTGGPRAGLDQWQGLILWLAIGFLALLLPIDKSPKALFDFKNEKDRILHHPILKLLFWVAPLLYLSIYSAVYAQKHEWDLPIALVQKESPLAAERLLLRSLDAHPRLSAIPMSQKQAEEAFAQAKVRGVLEIPADIEDRMRRGEPAVLPLWVLTDRFIAAGDVQRSIAEVIATENVRRATGFWLSRGQPLAYAKEKALALRLDDHPLANPAETYGDFMLPAVGILVLNQLLLMGLAYSASLGQNRWLDLVKRWAFWMPWFAALMMAWTSFGLRYWDNPVHANAWGVVMLCGLGALAIGAMATLIGLCLGRSSLVLQVLAFSSYPLFFLSGYGWPLHSMPDQLQKLSEFLPLGPLLRGLRQALMGVPDPQLSPFMIQLAYQALFWIALIWIFQTVVRIFAKKGISA